MQQNQEETQQYSSEQIKKIKFEGIRVILGGICLHLMLGTFYLWGGINPYVSSYLRSKDSSTSKQTMSLVFPFMALTTNSVSTFGIKIAMKVGFKQTIFCGTMVMALAMLIVSFIQDMIGFIILYSVLIGISTGLMYMLPIICGWKYFPFKRGLVSGSIIAGYGFGAFLFTIICQKIANPDNLKPNVKVIENDKVVKYFEKNVYDNVPTMFRVLFGIFIVLGVLATLLIKYPKDLHMEMQVEQNDVVNKEGDKKIVLPPPDHHECKSSCEGIHSKPFILLNLMVLCSSFFGMFIANYYKLYGEKQLDDDEFLSVVGAVGAIFNGCSRAFWAIMFDKFGFKRVYFVIIAVQMAISATMSSISEIKALYLIWICLTYFTEGGQFSVFPAVTAKVFGHKIGPLLYGFIFFEFAVSNLFAFILHKFTLDDINYDGIFWIGFGLTVLAGILNLFFKEKINWGEARKQKEQNYKKSINTGNSGANMAQNFENRNLSDNKQSNLFFQGHQEGENLNPVNKI